MLSIILRPEGPAQIVAPVGAQIINHLIYLALTEGATSCRSFGPKA